MERRRISGHAPMEPVVGCSRAVVALHDPRRLVEIEAEALIG